MIKQRKSLGTILATGMIGLSSLLSGCETELKGTSSKTDLPKPTPTPVRYTFNINEGSRIFDIRADRLNNFAFSEKDMDGDGDLDVIVGYTMEDTNYDDGELHIAILENKTPQQNKSYQAESPQQ